MDHFPRKGRTNYISQCQGILKGKSVYIRGLTQALGRLSSSEIAVLGAPFQHRAIQSQ